jgi:hypothetical protein
MGDYEGEVEKDLCQPRLNKWGDEEPEAPTKEEALRQHQAHRLNNYGKRR